MATYTLSRSVAFFNESEAWLIQKQLLDLGLVDSVL